MCKCDLDRNSDNSSVCAVSSTLKKNYGFEKMSRFMMSSS